MAIFVNHRASLLPESLCGSMRMSDEMLCRFAPGHRGGHSWETTTATLGELEALDADHARLREAVRELADKWSLAAASHEKYCQQRVDEHDYERAKYENIRYELNDQHARALREILERESWTT